MRKIEERFPESREISGSRCAISREELRMLHRILAVLGDGPKTVPEVAAALGVPSHEAMWWMMGYVRFGYIEPAEGTTDDGYIQYGIVTQEE